MFTGGSSAAASTAGLDASSGATGAGARAVTTERRGRVGCKNPVVAMPVLPRRRDQRGDTPDQLQRREDDLGTPVRARLGQVVDQPLGIDLFQSFGGERRPSVVARSTLRAIRLMGLRVTRAIRLTG